MELHFLILFSDYSLQLHINTIDFCILLLYPIFMLKLFTSYNTFLLDSLGYSLYKIDQGHKCEYPQRSGKISK